MGGVSMTTNQSPKPSARADRFAHGVRYSIGAFAAVSALAGALPAAAQFTANEGFDDSGKAKVTVEATPYVYLPHLHATVGLDRPPGQDIIIDRPRPTIADLTSSLSGAFTCDCILHYGNWEGEVNVIYLSLKQKTTVPPLPPSLPSAVLNTKLSAFYISPGIGYRVFTSNSVGFYARAGFTYAELSADSDFQFGEFAGSGSHSLSVTQPWIGERFDYYPSRKWRIENTFALTGLGVDGGSIGWNGKLNVSYLVTKWFDIQAGYMANQLKKDTSILPNGADRSANVLMYGPEVGFGFRF
jgi:hypothetical protein